MIKAGLGEPFKRTIDRGDFHEELSFTRVTVSIDVMTPVASDCLTHLVAAANEFGERPLRYDVQVQTRSDQSGQVTGGKGWLT